MTLAHPTTGEVLVETPGVLAEYATPTGLDLPDGLDFEEWTVVGGLLAHIEQGVMWWIGDWWRYGERAYGDATEAAAPTGYALQTVKNAARVAKKIELSRRRDNLTFGHHDAVAALEPPEADRTLANAVEHDWTVADTRAAVRRLNTARRIGKAADEAPDLEAAGLYQVLYADPPWRYEHAEPTRAVENNYPTMTVEDIGKLHVPTADDSVLFLWATSPKLSEAMDVIDCWGFEYRTSMAWVKADEETGKQHIGMGYYARQQHELLLIAKRGDLPVPAEQNRPASVVTAPRGMHSAKPTVFYELIERMYPGLARVELFARNERDGWARWGNQVEVTA